MKKSPEVNIMPEIIKMYREASGYSIAEISRKIKITSNEIEEVERGNAMFTLSQIKILAELCKRPLVAFFTEDLPERPKISDFRINREKRLTPEVYIAERRACLEDALNEVKEFERKYAKQFPTATEVLASGLEEYLTYYLYPESHWKRIRTSNVI